jgi:hypothetical protein
MPALARECGDVYELNRLRKKALVDRALNAKLATMCLARRKQAIAGTVNRKRLPISAASS